MRKAETLDFLNQQQSYNSKKSSKYKKLYYWFEVGMIFFTCLTTLLLSFGSIPSCIPAITSFLIILLKSISALFSFQKEWLLCRSISEKLKSEKRKYLSSIGDYDLTIQEEKDEQLAKNVELIIQEGNIEWYTEHMEKEQEK